MRQTVHLGRIRGIEIGANWSLVIIVGLITWTLAADVLPSAVPGYATAAYWATGVLTAGIFFASLVAHEVSHAIVARRHGIEVKQITLWLFGGVAKLEADSGDASSELRIGVVGPAVSLALGVVALALAAAVAVTGRFDLLVEALAWVGAMNVLLAVFNLMPAFPLDGGRVLRAVLWHRSGDRVRATRQAGQAGTSFGTLLVVLGILLLMGGFLVDGLWFMFIGWFLRQAATAEVAAVTEKDLLQGLRVADIMSPDPQVAPAEISVAELLDHFLLRLRHSAYPVIDRAGAIVGLVTLDGIRRLDPALRSVTSVGAVAIPLDRVPVLAPQDAAMDAMDRVARSDSRRALVLDGGRLVGIVTQHDVMSALDYKTLSSPAVARPEVTSELPSPPKLPGREVATPPSPTTDHRN